MQLQNAQDVTQEHKTIYLSPHFDDAVYSCGGTIALQARQGQRPLVITVFAGLPERCCGWYSLAYRVHRGMGFNLLASRESRTIVIVRRQEDRRALACLDADALWLNYLDAVYRGRPPYYTQLHELIGGKLHQQDMLLLRRLEEELLVLHKRLPGVIWYVPLGVGGHLDHQIVSRAAEGLIANGASVRYYEDFPYVADKNALERRHEELSQQFSPLIVGVSETLHLREKAAALYASQVQISFRDSAMMHRLLEEYTRSLDKKEEPVERYWLRM